MTEVINGLKHFYWLTPNIGCNTIIVRLLLHWNGADTLVFILHLSVPLCGVELSHDWSFAVSINSTSTANVRSIIHLPKILTKPTKESFLWPTALTISNQNNGIFKMFNVLSPLIHKDKQPRVLTNREKWRIKRFPHRRNKYSFGSPVGSKCLGNPNVE